MNWKEHAMCRFYVTGDYEKCNADRAELIAEGERLQDWVDDMQANLERQFAENSRLVERVKVLEALLQNCLDIHHIREAEQDPVFTEWFAGRMRAALSGDKT